LAVLKERGAALVIVDLPLSGDPDGSEMIKRIRDDHPQDELPVIVLFAGDQKGKELLKAKSSAETLDKTAVSTDDIVNTVSSVILGTKPQPIGQKPKAMARISPAKPIVATGAPKALKDHIDEMITKKEEEVSIIDLVESMMKFAFLSRASDIHLEPFEDRLAARLRIDGILHDMFSFPKILHSGIITRIKVLGGMRTDEHQAAQDGRFKTVLQEPTVEFDVRVSIVPTYYGENAVLRLLAEQTTISSIDDLALTEADKAKIHNAVAKPYGMILATGPTGSGKTTTLYTILKGLNTREVQIITIEDPIEYSLEGVDQIQVNTRTSLTFANGLRSILRQDPNVIMVGEIRDEETASIAINAALTGHKVLTTIHTNDAATTLPRLHDMGVEPFLVASTINIAIGQRLVRMICQTCKEKRQLTEAEFDSLKAAVPPEVLGDHRDFFMGKGCEECGGTGYKGRMGIYEVLEVNDFVRDAIMRNADAGEIKKIAIKNGMVTLLEDAFIKAISGLTTIEEVLRVIRE